ncbi:MAG TPA: type I methionyl aminopeptidase [Fimbriiglobus sp.]|jgi:methionyl aminopeptidase
MALFSKKPDKPPILKSPAEIAEMRRAGVLVAQAHQIVRDMANVGVRTIDIDRAVEAFYLAHDAIPLFKGYPGKVPFPACTCLSINEEVVHGVPGNRQLKDGDLLKVDTACKFPKDQDGWCADRAVTIPIGNVRPERLRLIKVAQEVLQIAIDDLPRRRWWSEVASRMQRHVEQNGFATVDQFVGHGIGRVMHESPQVPNFVTRETRKHDFKLVPGLVLAIEPMVNMAKGDVLTNRDHWTVVTKDGLPSVHVEHTVALTADGVVIVTSDEGVEKYVPKPAPVSELTASA